MKLQQIVNAEPALSKLLAVSLPAKTAYKLSKFVFKIEPELKIFKEQRDKLIKELGKENEDKTGWQVSAENMPKYVEEITKLSEIEVPIEFGEGKEFSKLNIEEFGDTKLEAQDLVAINFLLE